MLNPGGRVKSSEVKETDCRERRVTVESQLLTSACETGMLSQSLKITIAVLGFGLLTAACGDRPVDRALTGGAIGAAGGAVVGSTVGAPVTGAVVGGAAGATVGAVTAPER